jgi:hypothetical protein
MVANKMVRPTSETKGTLSGIHQHSEATSNDDQQLNKELKPGKATEQKILQSLESDDSKWSPESLLKAAEEVNSDAKEANNDASTHSSSSSEPSLDMDHTESAASNKHINADKLPAEAPLQRKPDIHLSESAAKSSSHVDNHEIPAGPPKAHEQFITDEAETGKLESQGTMAHAKTTHVNSTLNDEPSIPTSANGLSDSSEMPPNSYTKKAKCQGASCKGTNEKSQQKEYVQRCKKRSLRRHGIKGALWRKDCIEDPSDSKGNSAESLTSVSPSYNSVTGEDKMYGLPDIADFMGYKDQKALSEQGLPNNKGIFADQKSNVYDQGDYINAAETLLRKDVHDAYATADALLNDAENDPSTGLSNRGQIYYKRGNAVPKGKGESKAHQQKAKTKTLTKTKSKQTKTGKATKG